MKFIARHDLPCELQGSFGLEHLLHGSEFGLVGPDVRRAAAWLARHRNLHPWAGETSTFKPLGNAHGTLIVVPRGRGWFPIGLPAEPPHSASGTPRPAGRRRSRRRSCPF